MFKRIAISILLIWGISAQAKECTQYEAAAAESVTDYLHNWQNYHQAYSEYSHCDDGAIAEGFAEAAARLFVDHWSALNEYVAYASKDEKFEAFVLRHLNETLNYDDILAINKNASVTCSNEVGRFCKKIEEATRQVNGGGK